MPSNDTAISDETLNDFSQATATTTPQVSNDTVKDFSTVNPGASIQNAIGTAIFAPIKTADWLYSKAAGPTAPQHPIQSATEYLGEKIERPLGAITGGLTAAEQGQNPLPAIKQNLTGQAHSTWTDFILNSPNFMPHSQRPQNVSYDDWEKMRQNAAQTLGVVPNLVYDPAMHLHGMGTTGKGLEAEQLGKPAATLGEAANKGERALLTMGNVPIVQGKPVLEGMTAANQALKSNKYTGPAMQAFTPWNKVPNTEFAHDLQNMFINKQNLAQITHNEMKTAIEKEISGELEPKHYSPELQQAAKENLNKKMMEAVEPSGSQTPGFHGPFPSPETILPKRIDESGFPIGSLQISKQTIQDFKNMAPDKERSYYIEHNAHPDFIKELKTQFPESSAYQKALEQTVGNDSIKERGVMGGKTVNEWNNIAREGKLGNYKEFAQLPQMSKYTGKVFDDDFANVASSRYLEHAKVKNTDDFMGHVAKTYGIPVNAWRAMKKEQGGAIQTKDPALMKGAELERFQKASKMKNDDYILFHDKSWEKPLYVPKEIEPALRQIRGQEKSPGLVTKIAKAYSPINNFFKFINFGAIPAAVPKILFGNQALAALHGMWAPFDHIRGMQLASRMRSGKFTDKPILFSPRLGPVTDRQFVDMAKQHRMVNMGLAQNELMQEGTKTGLQKGIGWTKGLTDKAMAAHNFVEDSTRMGTGINALEKGYAPEGAGAITRKYLYDYSEMGQGDRAVNNVTPFYNFARHNMEEMAKNWIRNPGLMNVPYKIQQEANRNQDTKNMSEWMREQGPVYVGNKNGTPMYWMMNHFLPQSDINEMLGSGKDLKEILSNTPAKSLSWAGSMINPALKEGLQQAFNKDFFFGNKIQDFPGQKAVLAGQEMPSRLAHALKNFAPIMHLDRAKNPNVSGANMAGRYLAGVNVQPYDPKLGEINFVKGEKHDLKDALMEVNKQKYIYGKTIAGPHNPIMLKTAKDNLDAAIENYKNTAKKMGGQ